MAVINNAVSTGEWARWLETDREFKTYVRDTMSEHGERLARIEATKTDAARAENAAVSTKKWAMIGGAAAAIINGFLLVFGSSK